MAVTIYTTAICPFCVRAKSLLDSRNIAYDEIRVDGDDNARITMMERAGGARSVPQIFIGDHHIGGSDDLYALSESALQNLLDKNS